jgi:hypothetical protein
MNEAEPSACDSFLRTSASPLSVASVGDDAIVAVGNLDVLHDPNLLPAVHKTLIREAHHRKDERRGRPPKTTAPHQRSQVPPEDFVPGIDFQNLEDRLLDLGRCYVWSFNTIANGSRPMYDLSIGSHPSRPIQPVKTSPCMRRLPNSHQAGDSIRLQCCNIGEFDSTRASAPSLVFSRYQRDFNLGVEIFRNSRVMGQQHSEGRQGECGFHVIVTDMRLAHI